MWVGWLDLASVLSEVVDILAEGFHILAGVFKRLTLHFGRNLVLVAGASTASEFDGESVTHDLSRGLVSGLPF